MNYTEKFAEIRRRCRKGNAEDICVVLSMLNDAVDLPTTRAIDLYLSEVENSEGIQIMRRFLFFGTQIQRNYCCLFFARRNDWDMVNQAYAGGKVDAIQAYSR